MSTSLFESMTDAELDLIEARIRRATSGPWASFVEGRDHTSGSSFIRTPISDIELSGATAADHDFVAHARDDLPRLLEEVRTLRRRAASG
jgi:hypothetical protein